MDYYNILGIDKSSSEEDIKKQFKKLAKKYHPDRGGDSEKFKQINEAYNVLSDPEKRQKYDMFGNVEMGGVEMPDINDLFGNLFGMNFGSNNQSSKKKKSPPKQYDLFVSLEEIYNGKTIPFNIKKKKFKSNNTSNKCILCKGTGNIIQQIQMGFMITQNVSTCSKCFGNGYIFNDSDFLEIDTVIDVPLPRGLPEGNPILIRNKGDEYPGMEIGDIIFQLRYKKHSVFESLENCDLKCIVKISLYEYFYGFDKIIEHLNGEKIAIHSSSNLSFNNSFNNLTKVLKDYGLKFQNHIGDLIIKFEIDYSNQLTLDPVFKQLIMKYSPPINKVHNSCIISQTVDISSL